MRETTKGPIYSDTASITIQDLTPPSAPTIIPSGTEGQNGWYASNVSITITPGADNECGVRPIVTIPLSSITITKSTTSGMDYDIKAK